jgi:hypothetical protein
MLASQPQDEECIRLLDCAIRNTDLSAPEERQLLIPLEYSLRSFTEDEALAYALSQEAVRMSLARVKSGASSADQLSTLSRRLCALTKYSCEPDPGEIMTRSLDWLERAGAQDPSVVTSASMKDFDHLDSAVFATTTHLRTLVRIVRATGSSVGTVIFMLRSVGLRLVQDGDPKEGTELLIEAAQLVCAWEYASQFEEQREEEREMSRKYSYKDPRPGFSAQIANDLRKALKHLKRRHVRLVFRAATAIVDLDRIAALGP